MATTSRTRQNAVDTMLERVQNLVNQKGVSRDTLDAVLKSLQEIATQPELWSEADFPPPSDGERQARYLIQQQDDQTFALYLNVMKTGRRIPPHNHTTWACIAGVAGEEVNTVFERLDDGSREGYAELVAQRDVLVGPGSGIALMPDDIHSVLIDEQPGCTRHLHLYGDALETLGERIAFDIEHNTCKRMEIGVKTRSAGGR